MIRERWKRWLMVVFGALCLVVGVLSFSGASLVMIPFGVVLVAVGLLKPSEPGSTKGVSAHDGATVFAVSGTRERVAAAGCFVFAVAGLGFLLFPAEFEDGESNGYVRLLGVACIVLFGGMGLASARRAPRGGSAILLTPEALTMRVRSGLTTAPWASIGEVKELEVRGQRFVGLRLAYEDGVVMPGLSMFMRRMNRTWGIDLSIPLTWLESDPDAFQALLVHMHEHPGDRPLLADPGGVDVLRRLP
jgi:hypothetical protein